MRGEGVLLSWTDLGTVETVCRQLLEARQQAIAKSSTA
jgi:hypothetical protein